MKQIKSFIRRYPATAGLLSVSVAVFLTMQVLHPFQATTAGVIYQFGGLYGAIMKTDPSQLWRLVSPLFVHIGWEHLLFNGMALLVLGQQLEAVLGWKKFVALYLLSGVMGSLFALVLTPDAVVAGASSSLYGLSGMFAVLYVYVKNPYLRQLARYHVGFLVSGFALSLVTTGVSLAGHLGGAVGGALCAFFIPLTGERKSIPLSYRLLAIVGYVLLVLACLWWTYR